MKRYLLLFILLNATAFAQPRIKFEQTSYDFGEIEQGPSLFREIKFTNVGDKPLIIEATQTPDAASIAHCSYEPVMPGKTGIIYYKRDTSFPGRFTKSITVKSNDPLQEVLVLSIKVLICPKP